MVTEWAGALLKQSSTCSAPALSIDLGADLVGFLQAVLARTKEFILLKDFDMQKGNVLKATPDLTVLQWP